jgi:hypothetical protein
MSSALQPWLPQTPEAMAATERDEAVVDALTDEPGDAEADE